MRREVIHSYKINRLIEEAKITGYADGIAESKTAKLSTFTDKAIFGFNRAKKLMTDKDTWEKRATTYRTKYDKESTTLKYQMKILTTRNKKIDDLEWELGEFRDATGAKTPDEAEKKIANLEDKLQKVIEIARTKGHKLEIKLDM